MYLSNINIGKLDGIIRLEKSDDNCEKIFVFCVCDCDYDYGCDYGYSYGCDCSYGYNCDLVCGCSLDYGCGLDCDCGYGLNCGYLLKKIFRFLYYFSFDETSVIRLVFFGFILFCMNSLV
jgi:hypothetical protein